MKRFVVSSFLAFLAIFGFSANGAFAQAPAKALPDEAGALYLGNGQALSASEPRLLTKNAHVSEFLCAPTGTRVAYISAVPDGKDIDEAVGIANPADGGDTVYYRRQDPAFLPGIFLYGWTDDAAYFAFSTSDFTSQPTPHYSPPMIATLHIVDLVHQTLFDVALPFDQMVPPATADDPTPRVDSGLIWSRAVWAPGQRLLALTLKTESQHIDPDLHVSTSEEAGLCLFDPEKRTSRLLFTQPGELRLDGWKDATHIVYHGFTSDPDTNICYVYDLATGKATPQAAARRLARSIYIPDSVPASAMTASAQGNETLSLFGYSQTALASHPPPGQDGPIRGPVVDNIWIKRTGGRTKPSLLLLDSLPLRMDHPNSGAQFLPNGGFDRGGFYHVVYEADGDLKVVDLVPRGATPEEKVAGGEPLSCDEEIVIAQDDARDIGLGILQYAQDYNETLPAGGDGFRNEINFYVKSDSLFTTPNGVQFKYTPPESLKLADMDDPASTPLGEFDLPCKRVVLEGEGHVKVLPYDKNSSSP